MMQGSKLTESIFLPYILSDREAYREQDKMQKPQFAEAEHSELRMRSAFIPGYWT